MFYGGGVDQLLVQTIGVLGAAVYVAVVSFIILYALKKTIGLRVTPDQEISGLDISEHGSYGYPEHLDPTYQQPPTVVSSRSL